MPDRQLFDDITQALRQTTILQSQSSVTTQGANDEKSLSLRRNCFVFPPLNFFQLGSSGKDEYVLFTTEPAAKESRNLDETHLIHRSLSSRFLSITS